MLQLENLQARELLAADVMPFHNNLIAHDVNQDFTVSPLDALLVVNALNAGGSRYLGDDTGGEGELSSKFFIDVNGDNILSPIDAMSVINRLNAEGENGALIGYSYEITDTAGNPIQTASVGQTFRVNVFVQDLRETGVATGVFSAGNDLGVTNLDLISFPLSGDFTAAIDFGPEFSANRSGDEGGGIALLGNVPSVVDGDTFTIDAGNGPVSFEFDGNSTVEAGNNVITLPSPLTFTALGNSIRNAINASSLGVTATSNGSQVVGLPEGLTYDFSGTNVAADPNLPGSGRMSLGESRVEQEFFNEVAAIGGLALPDNPTDPKLHHSLDILAVAAGTVTFSPNQPELKNSEHALYNNSTVIPPEMIMFGDAFSFTIIADPSAPTAVNDSLTIDEDNTLAIGANVLANDRSNATPARTLTVQSVSVTGSTLGTVNGTTYTPPADYFGTDVITYVAVDSSGFASNTATVTITVNPINDAPNANNDLLQVDEESSNNTLSVLANDNGGPANESGDTLTITTVGTPSNGGVVTIAANGRSLIYTPAADFVGTDTFSYTIQDQGGLTDTATVSVEVEPLVLPRGRTDMPPSTPENTPLTIDVLANDRVNENSDAILISAANGMHGTVTINDNGTPADASDDTVTYTPNDENFFGTDSFTYVMNDTSGLGQDSTGTVNIVVTDVNDTPVLVNDTGVATEDQVATYSQASLLANDSPGIGENSGVAQVPQTLTITAVTALTAGAGSVVLNGSNVVYTPAPNFNGQFQFTYTATDNGTPALSSTATVVVTVAAVNDNPTAGADSASTAEDTALTIAASTLLGNDSVGPADEVAAGQTLTLTGVSASSAAGGSVVRSGTQVVYTPAADFNGSDTFTYTISDGAGGTATGTVTVTVTAVNDAPRPNATTPDAVRGFKDIPLSVQVVSLLENDVAGPADEAGQTLRIVSVSTTEESNGTAVLNSDGTITFTPTPGYTGPASFEYLVRDNGTPEGEATGTVNVTIEEFVPTTISGIAFVDETGDGIFDAAEKALGGVQITISGTSLGETFPSRTIMTLSDGSYSFDDLGPGQYVVTFHQPHFMLDGMDIAGGLGDADSIENQFTVNVVEPGGLDASGYHFAVRGVEAAYARTLDQLASSFTMRDSLLAYNGAYFGIGADNSLLWSAALDGYDDAVFMEAVLTNGGTGVLLTYVDDNQDVFSAQLGRGQFVRINDASGNSLIRVLGSAARFDWEQVDNLATPPFSATKYLDSVDAVFDQEGWGGGQA